MSLNQELSDLFASLATLMELKGENTFKVIAFQKVSRILRETGEDLRAMIEAGTVGKIEGIGKSSLAIIEEYANTGKCAVFDEITAEIPKGLPQLMQIEGMGPKTANLLWKERSVTSLAELEKALASNLLDGLKGIGPKKLEAIRAGIAALKARTSEDGTVVSRALLGHAYPAAMELVAQVRQIPGIIRAEVAGSLRRMRETVADIDIVAAIADAGKAGEISAAFTKLAPVVHVILAGETKTSVKISLGRGSYGISPALMQVDLRMVPQKHFGATLLYFTGSKDHNVRIRGLVQKAGLTLNEWGLYRVDQYDKAEKKLAQPPAIEPLASKTEEDVYAAMKMAYVPPEMREDRGEVELALANKLPVLITRADIKGDLHSHTTASDGSNSIEEMAAAAMALGYKYLAITDHSKASFQANGLTPERLIKHIAAVRKAQENLKGFTLFVGSEVDILVDGRLDYEDAILKELDIVIASPHISLKQDPAKATDRLLAAINHRYVNIIGHPTGRILNGRAGLSPDFARLYEAAAKAGTALEINAGYPRLDLDDLHAKAASAAGVMIVVDTDAHGVHEFEQMAYGIGVARRAWLGAKDVLNTRGVGELRKFLSKKR